MVFSLDIILKIDIERLRETKTKKTSCFLVVTRPTRQTNERLKT